MNLQVQLYPLIWICFPADCQTEGWRGRVRGRRLNNQLTSAASEPSASGATGTIPLDYYFVFGLGRDWSRTEGLDQSGVANPLFCCAHMSNDVGCVPSPPSLHPPLLPSMRRLMRQLHSQCSFILSQSPFSSVSRASLSQSLLSSLSQSFLSSVSRASLPVRASLPELWAGPGLPSIWFQSTAEGGVLLSGNAA